MQMAANLQQKKNKDDRDEIEKLKELCETKLADVDRLANELKAEQASVQESKAALKVKEGDIEKEHMELAQACDQLENLHQQQSEAKADALGAEIAKWLDLLNETQEAFNKKQRDIDCTRTALQGAKKSSAFAQGNT